MFNQYLFPEPEQLLKLGPEETGFLILRDLIENRVGRFGLFEYVAPDTGLRNYLANKPLIHFQRALIEGWMWLESDGLLAPSCDEYSCRQKYVTQKGRNLYESKDLQMYLDTKLLSRDLDPLLREKVESFFLRGQRDGSVFQAYKEVEIRMREVAGLDNSCHGTKLVKECFHPDTGRLIERDLEDNERQSLYNLFQGAVGYFRNPCGHRDVELTAKEAAALINFADYLIGIIEVKRGMDVGEDNTSI